MSIHVALNHVTHYTYDRLITLSPQIVRLRPAAHCRTRILSYSLSIEPENHFINWQQDPQNNYLARLVFPEKTKKFKVTVDLVAEMAVHNPFDFFLEPIAEKFPFEYGSEAADELAPFLVKTPASPLLNTFVQSISRTPTPTVDFLVALNQRISDQIHYLIRMEPGVQSPEETLSNGSGSCRDSAWLLVNALRHLGLAARFVSGYLIQLTADVKALDGPSGPESDFTDLHAWCEVYLPGAGWVGLDPTSGLMAGEGHIPLACSPEPSSAAPISGLLEPCEVSFEHTMAVQRIYESPRMTKPYSEEVWAEINTLGQTVDKDLFKQDVRLTMGGEPTFVADSDRDGEEWNTTALGPTKRSYAVDLLHHLAGKYGQGGFVHMGQGKWYPGEQLPRWAMSLYWRVDGQPLWNNPELFADERQPHSNTGQEAQVFIQTLAKHLAVDAAYIVPAHEDVFYYMWRERKLPVNVDVRDSRINNKQERDILRNVFEGDLSKPIGYILPLEHTEKAWASGPWFFRGNCMYLIPGESPVGYRLPLDSLPWVAKEDAKPLVERDPSDPELAKPLSAKREFDLLVDAVRSEAADKHNALAAEKLAADSSKKPEVTPPKPFESAKGSPRTALCVEARKGIVYVFMPPLEKVEHYLALLSALEATAQSLNQRIIIEGYQPPRDPRIKMLQITPDPGVIEVNIQPVTNWSELVENTTFLYESARLSRLSTEKFMLDGRHTGTGGGNHFVLGGATPNDSPFLRRPDVLASLLRFWINHPSLSYLFSGLFIGPTSQAPRVDEARTDQIYEIELALKELKRQQTVGTIAPWLIDRILRNLLIDSSGNTHRTEFCIDKLYSPDTSTGRLGLLEMRAFEMPPHARMSLVQQLMLRALVAAFWRTPYEKPLVRWGTELHDKFMLPSFVAADLRDVLSEIELLGYKLEAHWFDPHMEFRFPLVGDVQVNGMELTLRNALEPWHVMGEEGAPGGTVRYVDSSLERLEVKVRGFNNSRYVIACNGKALPMHPTGENSEYVAGVRYRAWQPASCLHPTIGVDAPLLFDIIDTWANRSVGGCQYHVAHPGGRNHEVFPVNGFEAESRRLARFFRTGHTPGKITTPVVERTKEHPITLDLRFK